MFHGQHLHARGGRVVGVGRNRAGVGAVREANKAGLAPRGAPRVADLPVATRGVDADGLDAVVHRGAALGHDAAGVGRPRFGVDAHRQRAGGAHVRCHFGLAGSRRGHGGVAGRGYLDHELGRVRLAAAGHTGGAGSVRVARLGFHARFGVLEAVLGETAVAAASEHVRGAGRHLLRRQNVLLAHLAHVVRLDLLGGGERPARPAVALVLDRGGVGAGPGSK